MSNEHEQYIGKKLSECPDGTKAVVADGSGFECVRELKGDDAHDCGDGNPMHYGPAGAFTILHIIRLGTPRLKTLADEEPGVAWEDGEGVIRWRDYSGEVIVLSHDGQPIHAGLKASGYAIHPSWTRRGKIIGLRFEGDE